jgi:hypothetical protein
VLSISDQQSIRKGLGDYPVGGSFGYQGTIVPGDAFPASEGFAVGASMSALPATNFSHLLDRRDECGAPPELPGDHVPAGDDHPNDEMTDAMPDQADASTSEIRKDAAAVIRARITEILDGHVRKSRGHYNFMRLPVPNDKIVITNRRGAYDVMRVLSASPAPETTVYVRWLASNRL